MALKADETRPEIISDPAMVPASWVAKALGCSVRHVLRMADGGLMPAPIKLGRLSRWSRKELEKWIAEGCPAVRRSRQ
jgi:excisionase family DNA binding protein